MDVRQKIEPLDSRDLAHLEAKRDWVRGHYDEAARHQYETLEGNLRLLETILGNRWIEPTAEDEADRDRWNNRRD